MIKKKINGVIVEVIHTVGDFALVLYPDGNKKLVPLQELKSLWVLRRKYG